MPPNSISTPFIHEFGALFPRGGTVIAMSDEARADVIVASYPWRPGDSDPEADVTVGHVRFRLVLSAHANLTYERYVGVGTRALYVLTTDLRRDGDVLVRLAALPLGAHDRRQATIPFSFRLAATAEGRRFLRLIDRSPQARDMVLSECRRAKRVAESVAHAVLLRHEQRPEPQTLSRDEEAALAAITARMAALTTLQMTDVARLAS
jgi:hypothetical protein